MDFSKISYQQLLNCASTLNVCAINMDVILNVELEALLSKLGNDNFWSGVSATEVLDTYNNLRNNFPNFSEDLRNFASKIESIVSEYQNADEKIFNQK